MDKNSEAWIVPRQHRKCSAIWPRSKARLQQGQKCGRFPDPMGTSVYLVEAEGRERSQPHMAQFSFPHEAGSVAEAEALPSRGLLWGDDVTSEAGGGAAYVCAGRRDHKSGLLKGGISFCSLVAVC